MKKPEEIKKGLECCSVDDIHCGPGCPYKDDCLEESRYKGLESDALAYIQQLESQVPRWIPVEERMPEHGRYLVAVKLTNRNTIKTATYNEHGWWIDLPAFDSEITHWMPLPEAPKEDAHG